MPIPTIPKSKKKTKKRRRVITDSDIETGAAGAAGAADGLVRADPDDPEIFEVEKIVAERKRKGKLEYKIRWKGCGSDKDTWEPAENLVPS
jgi:hypothetical protein